MLFRGRLITAGAWSDSSVSCCCSFFFPLCLSVPGNSLWHRLFLLSYFGVPRGAAAKGTAGVVKFEENTLPVVVFGFPWDSFFRMTTATVVLLQPSGICSTSVLKKRSLSPDSPS